MSEETKGQRNSHKNKDSEVEKRFHSSCPLCHAQENFFPIINVEIKRFVYVGNRRKSKEAWTNKAHTKDETHGSNYYFSFFSEHFLSKEML